MARSIAIEAGGATCAVRQISVSSYQSPGGRSISVRENAACRGSATSDEHGPRRSKNDVVEIGASGDGGCCCGGGAIVVGGGCAIACGPVPTSTWSVGRPSLAG
jgi:hypothetical protein